jgi:hypothetical protein
MMSGSEVSGKEVSGKEVSELEGENILQLFSFDAGFG